MKESWLVAAYLHSHLATLVLHQNDVTLGMDELDKHDDLSDAVTDIRISWSVYCYYSSYALALYVHIDHFLFSDAISHNVLYS